MTALTPFRAGSGLDLARRDPFFSRFFDNMFDSWEESARSWAPALDVVEEKDRYVVNVEVPGIDPKDVEIDLQGGLLTIRGERRDEHEEKKDGRVLRRESVVGSFSRTVRLPGPIVNDEVKARAHNGVMEITLPKAKEAIGRRIPIQAG